MPRHFAVRVLLSLAVIGVIVLVGIKFNTNLSLPFIVNISDAHHATLEPIKRIALPPGLVAGDRLDPALQPRSTRIAIMRSTTTAALPKNRTYDFVISRGTGTVTVPVATVKLDQTVQMRLYKWIGFLVNVGLADEDPKDPDRGQTSV